MEYDGRRPGNGWWNCPYPPEWVERMKRAAKACKQLTDEQVEAAFTRTELYYVVPAGDFLSEEQDERGLPLSWCEKEEDRYDHWRPFCDIFDYSMIPDVVVTNGEDDWPLRLRSKILTA